MPYRRLPKTDKARLRSLGQAVEACIQNGIYTNVLPHDLYHKAKNFLERFSREVSVYERSMAEQSSKRRNSKYETMITIGMRGERDSSMLGDHSSLQEKQAQLLWTTHRPGQRSSACIRERITAMWRKYKRGRATTHRRGRSAHLQPDNGPRCCGI